VGALFSSLSAENELSIAAFLAGTKPPSWFQICSLVQKLKDLTFPPGALQPMVLPREHLQACHSNISKQQLSKKMLFFARCTVLSVELVAGCCGG